MKNYADQGGCYPSRLEVEVDNILQDLHKFLTSLPSLRLSLKLWPILFSTVLWICLEPHIFQFIILSHRVSQFQAQLDVHKIHAAKTGLDINFFVREPAGD